MSTAVPPPSGTPPPPPPPPLPTLVLPQPPPALLKLPIGTLLQALNLPKAGAPGANIQLQLPTGSVNITAAWPLPPKSQLTFAIESHQPTTVLRLVSVNGKPATPAMMAQLIQGKATGTAQGGPFAAQPGGTQTQGVTAPTPLSGPVVVARGNAILATVLKPAAPGSPAANTAQSPVSPAPLQAAAAPSPGPLFPGSKQTAAPVIPGGTAPTPAASAPPTPSSTTPASPPLAPGTQVQVRIVATARPGSAAPSAPATPGTTPLTGTVTGTTAAGQPIVSTAQGQLALDTRIPLPQGTQVRLEALDLAASGRPQSSRAAGTPPPLDPLGREWPALKQAIEALQQVDPGAAQRLLDGAMPKPTARLGAQLLFFMSALRGGDLRQWMGGDASRGLAGRRPDVLERLGEDVKAMGRAASPSQSGDWRLYGLPLYDGQELAQVRLMVRDHPSGDEAAEEGETDEETRFIVDVDLTRMGRLQMDGLVKPSDKRFDLILRTVDPLSAEMRDHIRGLFKESAEITGFIGGISFQIGGGFVEPPSEARHSTDPRSLGLDV
ncbi:hypothetical protein [Magnetospira sp. QH-2]|uniref:hypothetical protein n=1 Tax=Magnetospira sp. (strain QH-2) TaxID=1288970 RepID=UPI0003E80B32|nr:hypothetical protein [Magnetospira sp. QH-2]CCQ73042.1 conserved protein of unknown function [Magnetospira sp. QH-2]